VSEEHWWQLSYLPTFAYLLSERGKVSERKLRLLMCACCRGGWQLLDEEGGRNVEVAERFADGQAGPEEWVRARRAAAAAVDRTSQGWDERTPEWAVAAIFSTDLLGDLLEVAMAGVQKSGAEAQQADLLRDVFANPYHAVSVNTAWLTPTALSLATAAYDDRSLPSGELDTCRLAVLADALEEAGCTEETILTHLRSPGPHVRGCWALDLVLARE
jgi:hypothetical protein